MEIDRAVIDITLTAVVKKKTHNTEIAQPLSLDGHVEGKLWC